VCEIGELETASELHDRMMVMGAKGLAETLQLMSAGKLEPEVQDESLVTYAHKLDKSESELDWTKTADELALQVRGLNAWPVAQTKLDGKVMRVWRAEVNAVQSVDIPGTILSGSKHIDVATGGGVLRLLEIQMPGKKRMQVDAYLHAHDVAGLVLG